MDIRKITIILTLIQTVKMEVEPCANSMWTESVINNCYTGHMENIEGRARLSLQMTLEKPYTFASYCQCQPSESEQLEMWQNLTAHLLPSLAILDKSVKVLSKQFDEVKELLKQCQGSNPDAVFRQSKTNHCCINKLHRRFS